MRCLRLAVVLAVLSWAAPLCAATVALVRPPAASPALVETLSRLHGELLSVGVTVEIADAPAGPPTRAWLRAMAAARSVDAVIAIVGDTTPMGVEIWLYDKASRTSEVARVFVEPNAEKPSERLAIRAVEVLRSHFLESDLVSGEPRATPAPKSTATVAAASAPAAVMRPEHLGLAAGAAVLTSLDGVGTALLPILRLDWAAQPSLTVQAALAGMGTRPMVANPVGNARVAQHYGVLGACYRFRPEQALRPFVALSAGALRTSVEGQADSSKQAHTVDQWSFLVEASAGTAVRLAGRYYLTIAAHAQVAAPYVAIHFVDEVVATSGRPNLLLTLTLGAWL